VNEPTAAGSAGLQVTHYNRDVPWLNARIPEDEHLSIQEMLDVYSPFGEIRTVLTALRAGLGVNGYQGSASPMSLDHVFRRIIGLPGLSTGLDRDIYGGGKGLTLHDSAMSSLGEAIERMLGSFSGLTKATEAAEWHGTSAELARLGRAHVGPKDLQIFAPEQFGEDGFLCEPWTAESRMKWIRGTNLVTGEPWWVPSQLVHMFYIRDRGEARIGVSSSGGLAAHLDATRAIRHGTLELIERDAANLSWFCRVLPQRLEIDAPIEDPKLLRWLDSAARSGTDVTFYVHRTDVPDVCVVTAIAVEAGLDEYCYLAGGGVGLHVESAMRSAVAELIQSERMVRTPDLAPGWRLVQGFERMFGIDRDASEADFQNFIQVVPYYGYAANQSRLDWYFRAADQPVVRTSELPAHRFADPAAELEFVRDICRRAGLTPVVFDFTPEAFKHVSLQKVFIPELVPAFPPNLKMLGHRRYFEFPMRLGLSSGPLQYADLTAEPLPYP
jgi:ribosomal protein S12 methylthiotransferase accessory factor